MKVLILEDSIDRITTFKRYLSRDHDLYFYDNVRDAKEALELLGPFDILFLDHDLDDKIYVNSEESNTGYQLAKWVAEKGIKFNEIILHSLNPAGVQNMKAILPEAKIVPFTNLFLMDLLLIILSEFWEKMA